MKPTLAFGTILAASVLSSAVHAAPGTLLRDESLYTQPSATSAVAAKASKGATVDIVGRQGGWLRIKSGKSEGWVRLLSVRAGSGGAGGAGLGDVVGAATTKSDPSRVVAVAGVRGLNEEELKQAKYSAEELARLDALGVTPAQAKSYADKSGLVTVNVPSLPKPKPKPEQSSSPWEEN
jgi:hypothetical protein